jgi:hypothetical protein
MVDLERMSKATPKWKATPHMLAENLDYGCEHTKMSRLKFIITHFLRFPKAHALPAFRLLISRYGTVMLLPN